MAAVNIIERMRLARNPRAARISFIIRKAASTRRSGDVRSEAYSAVGGGGGGGGGGSAGGSFNNNFEQTNR